MSCSKKTFETKAEAVARANEIKQEANKGEKIPVRSYRCPECGKFHLTSITKAEKKAIQKRIQNKAENKIQREAEYWMQKKGWREKD